VDVRDECRRWQMTAAKSQAPNPKLQTNAPNPKLQTNAPNPKLQGIEAIYEVRDL
jgi:hypothetical protein